MNSLFYLENTFLADRKDIIGGMKLSLHSQIKTSCRHLLSEINRDPTSASHGCFDRRYWSWKLSDFPEATFQRNVSNLAWFMSNHGREADPKMIREAVIAGLLFAVKIQHRDGSFDQAFPFERSFGATGFLIPDLVNAYLAVKPGCSQEQIWKIENCLFKASNFVLFGAERHGLISNHLAGAALGLFKTGYLFENEKFLEKASGLTDFVIANQSPEGWFPEYGGADPGYQSLCMHYLAQIYKIHPSSYLKAALEKSLEFLQYFIHPDGSFGGEYGSRRTEVFYPGGIALLANDFSTAASIDQFMRESIEDGRTVTLMDIDMGNTAPLLSSTILAFDTKMQNARMVSLPFMQSRLEKHFPVAGVGVYGSRCYYTILGASNGGVLKIFDKQKELLVEDDCGAFGYTDKGKSISTQSTQSQNAFSFENNFYHCESAFYTLRQSQTTPFNYLVLRILNLTFMRISFLNETIKKFLVAWLTKTNRKYPLFRLRDISFNEESIEIKDHFYKKGKLKLAALAQGVKFNAVHMASSRYFSGEKSFHVPGVLDHTRLNHDGELMIARTISMKAESAAKK